MLYTHPQVVPLLNVQKSPLNENTCRKRAHSIPGLKGWQAVSETKKRFFLKGQFLRKDK